MEEKRYTEETFNKIKEQIKILEAASSRSIIGDWLLEHYKLLLSTKKVGDTFDTFNNENKQTKRRLLPMKQPII